jgi:hypothetical protein
MIELIVRAAVAAVIAVVALVSNDTQQNGTPPSAPQQQHDK